MPSAAANRSCSLSLFLKPYYNMLTFGVLEEILCKREASLLSQGGGGGEGGGASLIMLSTVAAADRHNLLWFRNERCRHISGNF